MALLATGVLHGAETVVHQRSGGSSAYVESYGWDACSDRYVLANPSTYQMVSKAAGGKTTVTDASMLNAYVFANNWCTGAVSFAEFDAIPLTEPQFQLDAALNQATLQGALTVSWGYTFDENGNYIDLTGAPMSFAIQWQSTGTGPTAHTPTHFRGGSAVSTVNQTGTTVAAIASGFVSSAFSSATIANDYQYAVLSRNLKVSTTVKRSVPMIIPAGKTVSLTSATLNACDPLTYGYQINDGPLVPVGSKGWTCTSQPVSDVTIGPFATRSVLRLYVFDQSAYYCSDYPTNYTFFSDGLHGLVTGSDPWQVDIMDSGEGCTSPADQLRLPDAPGQGNLNVTVVTGP